MSYQLVETVVAYNVNTFIYCLLTFKIQRRWIFFEDPCILRPTGVKGGKKKREMKMELARTHNSAFAVQLYPALFRWSFIAGRLCSVLCLILLCQYTQYSSWVQPSNVQPVLKHLPPFQWAQNWVSLSSEWLSQQRTCSLPLGYEMSARFVTQTQESGGGQAVLFCKAHSAPRQCPLFPTVIAKFGDLSPTRVR